jgi:ABC-type Zn2+ transport system substrate-binding protein/surface adhesin
VHRYETNKKKLLFLPWIELQLLGCSDHTIATTMTMLPTPALLITCSSNNLKDGGTGEDDDDDDHHHGHDDHDNEDDDNAEFSRLLQILNLVYMNARQMALVGGRIYS